jgi:hypothetical protein
MESIDRMYKKGTLEHYRAQREEMARHNLATEEIEKDQISARNFKNYTSGARDIAGIWDMMFDDAMDILGLLSPTGGSRSPTFSIFE